MKITFSLGLEAGSLTIQREDGDREAKASGYTRSVHGWGAEIHLLGMIAKQMNAIGFGLARKRIACDDQFCHLYGDDDMCYLRTAIKRKRDCPHLWIVDGDYALRSSADDYNKGEKVQFNIRGNIFCERSEDSLQPDWFNKVKALCDAAGVPCKLSKNCSPPSYQVIDVQINYHYEAKLWTVSSFGFVNRNQLDDSEPIGDTDDFAEGDKEQAIAEAEGRAWLYLNQYNTRLVVVHLNGNEHVVFNLDKDNRITKSDAIEERWVFTDAELVAPENCRCDDEFNTMYESTILI
jgi:hypothetical protein